MRKMATKQERVQGDLGLTMVCFGILKKCVLGPNILEITFLVLMLEPKLMVDTRVRG